MIGHLPSNFESFKTANFYKTNQILNEFDSVKLFLERSSLRTNLFKIRV